MSDWSRRLLHGVRVGPTALQQRLQPAVDDYAVRMRFWTTPRRIEQWAAQTKLFFVLGMGRSGTAFIARLLDQDQAAYVCHEPVRRDFRAGVAARQDSHRAEAYIKRFRSREIFVRARRRDAAVYGEVNSALRRHVHALTAVFPEAAYLHLVRDGRAVVRSMMARATLTAADPYTATLQPPPGDPWYNEWAEMDRFARLCWYWQAENAFVRRAIGVTVRFEDLLRDYAYFSEKLLAPCGVHITHEQWAAAVAKPQNQTKRHALAKPADWSPAQNAAFRTICGAEMQANGYRLDE